MSNWSQKLLDYTHSQFEKRRASFGSRLAEIDETLGRCGEEEKLLLSYYYATLPMVDIGDYSPALFLETAGRCRSICSCGM